MAKRQTIPLSKLTQRVQLRAKTDPQTLADYMDAMKRGETFPAIHVVKTADGFIVADGNHRLLAALELGHDTIEADVHDGDADVANMMAIRANAHHGLRYSRDDKQKIAQWALVRWGAKSDRWIEKQLGGVLSQPFISKVRGAMEGLHKVAETGKVPVTMPERRYKVVKKLKDAVVAIIEAFSTAANDEQSEQVHDLIVETLRELNPVMHDCHLAWMLQDPKPITQLFVTPASYKPDAVWMREQAKAFVRHVQDSGLGADIVMHDRDGKFSEDFDQTLKDARLRVQKAAYRSPNTVAFVERFIQTLQQECLDYFIVFGERHMNHLVSEMVAYYHEARPHQAKDNDLLVSAEEAKTAEEREVVRLSDVRCKKRLGGLLKHYYRKAA